MTKPNKQNARDPPPKAYYHNAGISKQLTHFLGTRFISCVTVVTAAAAAAAGARLLRVLEGTFLLAQLCAPQPHNQSNGLKQSCMGQLWEGQWRDKSICPPRLLLPDSNNCIAGRGAWHL